MIGSDIGIDLGTASTIIYVSGKGIVLQEPSIVAIDNRTDKVIAVGSEAKAMLGRTANAIRVVQPLKDGVISDDRVTGQMLKIFLKKINPNKIFKPRICVCIPSKITKVQRRSVVDTVMSIGARNVFLIEEPVAAAIGSGIDISKASGIAVLDMGGGTTDIAVLSMNGIVCKDSIAIAGNTFNETIIRHIKETYSVDIGENSADILKREIAYVASETMSQPREEKRFEIKGQGQGGAEKLPQSIVVRSSELAEALRDDCEKIITVLQSVLKNTPPELVADISRNGLLMTGGGSMLEGLDELLTERIGFKAYRSPNPIDAVAIGTGESFKYNKKLLDGYSGYSRS